MWYTVKSTKQHICFVSCMGISERNQTTGFGLGFALNFWLVFAAIVNI